MLMITVIVMNDDRQRGNGAGKAYGVAGMWVWVYWLVLIPFTYKKIKYKKYTHHPIYYIISAPNIRFAT